MAIEEASSSKDFLNLEPALPRGSPGLLGSRNSKLLPLQSTWFWSTWSFQILSSIRVTFGSLSASGYLSSSFSILKIISFLGIRTTLRLCPPNFKILKVAETYLRFLCIRIRTYLDKLRVEHVSVEGRTFSRQFGPDSERDGGEAEASGEVVVI